MTIESEEKAFYHPNGSEKKAEVAILIFNKTDFKRKTVTIKTKTRDQGSEGQSTKEQQSQSPEMRDQMSE